MVASVVPFRLPSIGGQTASNTNVTCNTLFSVVSVEIISSIRWRFSQRSLCTIICKYWQLNKLYSGNHRATGEEGNHGILGEQICS